MKTSLSLAFGLGFLACTAAIAEPVKVGPLTLDAVWARATPGGAKVAAGYLKIENTGAETDHLVGGSADFAGRVEVHSMSMKDGVMSMKALPEGLEVPPNGSVELKPGADHLMFLEIKEPLAEGETRKVTLTFERAGSVEVPLPVAGIGARSAPHGR